MAISSRKWSRNAPTRLDGFNEKLLALYARGMTVRDIQAKLVEMYGVEVSPTLTLFCHS
ncbi:hypothetical protein IQ272_22895 [Chroococcidiopsidales cyanobacterium LEGE 13417]|nr:hypothetical protein [Chroococcidiopsidales cyanobacterium LEGE 13417]